MRAYIRNDSGHAAAFDRPAVLLLDDDQRLLAQLAQSLDDAGYDCRCSHDLPSAVLCARQAAPNLIISGAQVHGSSGTILCERLLHDEGIDRVPLVFLSSHQGPDIIRRPGAGKGAYYLRKPFEVEVLLELMDQMLWSTETACVESR